ncbi:arylsulfatase [Pontiella agarivorans]|uniref:Arylsulfatase n=1 Tax=Pontiella agarivorans TaxID=3038953 RepID=A0ABU5MS24_9BACT|nr:arylsulfatase [Pontiella agarivorans]MDZ8117009.1 arylsulfatase [Pontiella agarivorans]
MNWKIMIGLGLSVGALVAGSYAEKQPNVIILLADDQGYGDLSCHGNPVLKTPNLDKMHAESVRFTDFHASAICTPSRAQLMTGIDAVRNGAYNYGFGKTQIFEAIPAADGSEHAVHLMSDYFKANGYRTGLFGKWHLGDFYPYRPQDRGFEEVFSYPGASVWQTPNHWNNDCFNDVYLHNGEPVQTEGYCTDVWFDKTISFIEDNVKAEKPFFVYLPTSSMHTPQFVPEKYIEPYKDQDELVAYFFGMVANFDDNVGRLDAALQRLGVRDDTIVIYMSDNGGTLGNDVYNAGMTGKKCQIQDGGHRVPCFVRWPAGIPSPGRDVDDLTIIQDILPTLIDLCGLNMPWPQSFDGVSLKEAILAEKQELGSRMSVVQFSTKRVGLKGYSVLWNKWRLLDETDGVQPGEEIKLYNVANDSAQKNNVANQHPEVVKEMQDYYIQWRKSVEPSMAKNSKITIGYPGFESLELTCFDWLTVDGKGNPSQQVDVRLGMEMHGAWNVYVETPGKYELTFRRWPKEANTEISGGLPPHVSDFSKEMGRTDEVPVRGKYHNWKTIVPAGVYPAGEALPITEIRLSCGEINKTKAVKASDKAMRFVVDLPAGPIRLQGDFLDKQGEVVCGAYYADIKLMD